MNTTYVIPNVQNPPLTGIGIPYVGQQVLTPDTAFPNLYTLPLVHNLTSVETDKYLNPTDRGYSLYGRSMTDEISYGIRANAANLIGWRDANADAKKYLAQDVNTTGTLIRNNLVYKFNEENTGFIIVGGDMMMPAPPSWVENVPTKILQRERLIEFAAAAKSLYESPEIDETQNSQLALGLSAAMGGGHNAVPALKDNLAFEQKLQAKQLALGTYAQVLDMYYKTYTASAIQVGSTIAQTANQTAASIPTVVPLESQLAGDILANWQDTINTGQMRDQQIRQTLAGSRAMRTAYTNTEVYYPQGAVAEHLVATMGVRSQYASASTY
jgi:hypothetical protein